MKIFLSFERDSNAGAQIRTVQFSSDQYRVAQYNHSGIRRCLQTMTSGYVFRLCDADWSGFCPEVPSYLDGQVVC